MKKEHRNVCIETKRKGKKKRRLEKHFSHSTTWARSFFFFFVFSLLHFDATNGHSFVNLVRSSSQEPKLLRERKKKQKWKTLSEGGRTVDVYNGSTEGGSANAELFIRQMAEIIYWKRSERNSRRAETQRSNRSLFFLHSLKQKGKRAKKKKNKTKNEPKNFPRPRTKTHDLMANL